jgi:predicted nucleic acid-binding protein
MPVAFDSTTLSTLINPDARVPNDPATGKPVECARERVQGLVQQLSKAREKIIIPAPAAAEILTLIGPTNTDYLTIINRSRVFEVKPLDDLAAIELAFLNRDRFGARDRKNKLQPYQKVKVDRQILAICRAAGCDTLYTDDKGMITLAGLCGIKAVRLCELEIPASARQHKLDLEPHEPLPELEDDEIDDSEGDGGEPKA